MVEQTGKAQSLNLGGSSGSRNASNIAVLGGLRFGSRQRSLGMAGAGCSPYWGDSQKAMRIP